MLIMAAKTILLLIDVQNDFCPGGALAVTDGDSVIDPLNSLATALAEAGGLVAATQDWHTIDHISFASNHKNKNPGDVIDLPGVPGQFLWPDHCVQGEPGSAFHKNLDLKPITFILRKGFRKELDSYSAFFENDRKTSTGFDGLLHGIGIKTVIIGGLATDYCVFYSVMDSLRLGYKTIVVNDAIRAVGYPEGSAEKATKQMQNAGALFINSKELLKEIKK